ncbi:MAG TPA: DUF3618 domain-containing protein [Streptosporangiaceae bacterium]|nr:DUF3618 domain-containing protein [Streptosporangiaceae bacterium]
MTAHKPTSAGLTPADAPPDDIEALAEEIEQTRESLGETVEALAAKADIKARVQDKVTDVRQTVLASAGQVRQQMTGRAAQAGSAAWAAAPEPVRRAAKRAAGTARQRGTGLAVTAGAVILAGWLIARGRRR